MIDTTPLVQKCGLPSFEEAPFCKYFFLKQSYFSLVSHTEWKYSVSNKVTAVRKYKSNTNSRIGFVTVDSWALPYTLTWGSAMYWWWTDRWWNKCTITTYAGTTCLECNSAFISSNIKYPTLMVSLQFGHMWSLIAFYHLHRTASNLSQHYRQMDER